MIITCILILVLPLAAIWMLAMWRLMRSLGNFRIKKLYTAALEAPSVSVCIPARNETHAMTQCLERVLASDYRKLEVVVYDDSSLDDTSILIRSFAHAGVRFVPGGELPEGWLGKNHALETLAREASGTYVLFLDVDTFIRPNTISQLVGYMLTDKLIMSSVIPNRNDTHRLNVLFGHLRFFWELILSRKAAPATSSTMWMINRHVLLDTLGGFAPYKSEVEPESHIAAIIGTSAYHCLVSNQALGVTYEKKWSSQIETSRRLLFPLVGATWYGTVLGFLALILLNSPLFVVLSSFVFGWTIIQLTGVLVLVFYMGLYGVYVSHVWGQGWIIGMVLWPLVVLQELVLFIQSVWGYLRNTVTWKGRLVTAPVGRSDQFKIDN